MLPQSYRDSIKDWVVPLRKFQFDSLRFNQKLTFGRVTTFNSLESGDFTLPTFLRLGFETDFFDTYEISLEGTATLSRIRASVPNYNTRSTINFETIKSDYEHFNNNR